VVLQVGLRHLLQEFHLRFLEVELLLLHL